MIEIRNLSKTFKSRQGEMEVLKGIDLDIKKGEIFGVIGFSGAGKSTLIRCLNALEIPEEGSIKIGDKTITSLNKKELREARKEIGMIFQQFNLLESKTVYENIAFPLKIANYPKEEIPQRVRKLLEIVELSEKEEAYPTQLSGGQKQRVGIARALANNPEVLLSDEATSALDPLTTYSILELLKSINKQFGITIVLITHELDVIRYCCDNMAVIEDGKITENGTVKGLFLNPKSNTAKRFIEITRSFQNNFVFEGGEGI
ncbi:ATP-binding cassette domain-containing protein [Clostridium tertium]